MSGPAAVAAHVRAALTAGSVLLAAALLLTALVILPAGRVARTHESRRDTL